MNNESYQLMTMFAIGTLGVGYSAYLSCKGRKFLNNVKSHCENFANYLIGKTPRTTNTTTTLEAKI